LCVGDEIESSENLNSSCISDGFMDSKQRSGLYFSTSFIKDEEIPILKGIG